MTRLASDHTASPVIFDLGQDGRANRYVDEGAPLEEGARFGFAVFQFLSEQSTHKKLPMILDY